MAYDPASLEGRSLAENILREQRQLEAHRANYDSRWNMIAQRVDPAGATFQSSNLSPGAARTLDMFDSTAAIGLSRFSAVMESLVTPRHERWHGLRAVYEPLNEDDECREYLDEVVRRIFAARYSPRTNFADQVQRSYWNIGGYGTSAVFCDEALPGRGRPGGLRYRTPHLSEIYAQENFEGLVDWVNRKLNITSYQMAQRFGKRDGGGRIDISHLPAKVQKDLDAGKSGLERWEVIHCCKPNDDIGYNRADHKGMAFTSNYVTAEERVVLEQGGYRTQPYTVSRYQTAPQETYGRSPVWLLMPDIITLNEAKKAIIRRAQQVVEPPLLAVEDGALEPFNRRAGAVNPGYLGDDGHEKIKEMISQARLEIGLDLIQDLRGVVNDGLHVSLFQVLAEKPPNMTATQALILAQEKGQILAPLLGRQQSEFLGPLITREIDILEAAGQLPPMPEKLLEYGGQVEVEYDSPLNRLQMSSEAVGTMRYLELLMPVAQINPEVLDNFDADGVSPLLARAVGAPAKAVRSPEQIAALREQRATERQAQQLLEAAPVAAKAIKDLSQTQAVGRNQPPTIPYVQPET